MLAFLSLSSLSLSLSLSFSHTHPLHEDLIGQILSILRDNSYGVHDLILWSFSLNTHDIALRIKDLIETNRKLEEKIADLTSQMTNSIETNKLLIDEHQALQTLYNSHERKLKENQAENDQLVSILYPTLINGVVYHSIMVPYFYKPSAKNFLLTLFPQLLEAGYSTFLFNSICPFYPTFSDVSF